MNCAYDLHIHSCLSPCASDDMTPANIAGMARLKGLCLISLTDHNAGNNLAAMAFQAQQHGLLFVPGVEVTTREEVHVLVYFSELCAAITFSELIYNSLPDIPNNPELFGNQIVIGQDDRPCGTVEKLLIQASSFTIDEIAAMAGQYSGCAVPAHINRDSFSVLSNLGFIPEHLFRCVETVPSLSSPPIDPRLKTLQSSDAHYLGDIAEPNQSLPGVDGPQDFIDYINK